MAIATKDRAAWLGCACESVFRDRPSAPYLGAPTRNRFGPAAAGMSHADAASEVSGVGPERCIGATDELGIRTM